MFEGGNGLEDLFDFVYQINECINYNTLQEDTSLRKKAKQYLLEGKTINKGIGILKKI